MIATTATSRIIVELEAAAYEPNYKKKLLSGKPKTFSC
jgi:hypothetical protein